MSTAGGRRDRLHRSPRRRADRRVAREVVQGAERQHAEVRPGPAEGPGDRADGAVAAAGHDHVDRADQLARGRRQPLAGNLAHVGVEPGGDERRGDAGSDGSLASVPAPALSSTATRRVEPGDPAV